MITTLLQHCIADALKKLYNIDADAESLVLQATSKNFEGDYTFVVFPYVKQARKAPDMVGREIGEEVQNQCSEVKSFNVVKGFLNFVIDERYWLAFVAKHNMV